MTKPWVREYNGFESLYDIHRDIDEMWEDDELKDIPGEFTGTVKITVEYIKGEDET